MAAGRKTGGRQRGTPNKSTAELKAAILGAFCEVGGERYLVKVAKEDPRPFCTLLGKILPMSIGADPDAPPLVPSINLTIGRDEPKG